MDMKNLTSQMIGFNKSTIDNGFNALAIAWEQMEKMTSSYLSQFPGIPAEGKRVIEDWITVYRDGCDRFKKSIDENFKQLEFILKTR